MKAISYLKLVSRAEIISIGFAILYLVLNLEAAQQSLIISIICYWQLLVVVSHLVRSIGLWLCYQTHHGFPNEDDQYYAKISAKVDLKQAEIITLTGYRVLVGVVITLALGKYFGLGYFVMYFGSQGLDCLIKTYYDLWIKNTQPVLENARKEFILALRDQHAVVRGVVYVKGKGSFFLKQGYNADEFDLLLDFLDIEYDQEGLEDGIVFIQGYFDLTDGAQVQRYYEEGIGEGWLLFKKHDLSEVTDNLSLMSIMLEDSEDPESLEAYLKEHPEELGVPDETNRTWL